MILITKEQFEQAILAKQEIKTKTIYYTGELINSIPLSIGTYSDKGIYAGIAQGKQVWVAMNDAPEEMNWDKAVECCNNIQGHHLPTKEELMLIYANKDIINKALVDNGGEDLKDGYYWSSTEYDYTNSWKLGMNYGNFNGSSKYTNYNVRAVFSEELIKLV